MAETMVKTRWVYAFGGGSADGDASMKNLLGGKGANLAEMSSLGLPVPPGFTITTEACVHYYSNGQTYPAALADQVAAAAPAPAPATAGGPTPSARSCRSPPVTASTSSGARSPDRPDFGRYEQWVFAGISRRPRVVAVPASPTSSR